MALGLPQLKILWQQELEGYIEVTVIYHRGEARCPRCGKVTHKEHDRRLRDKVVFLTLVKRTARKSGKRRGNGGSRGARAKEGRGVSG